MEKKFLKLICPGIKHHEDFIAAQNVNKQKKKTKKETDTMEHQSPPFQECPYSFKFKPSYDKDNEQLAS